MRRLRASAAIAAAALGAIGCANSPLTPGDLDETDLALVDEALVGSDFSSLDLSTTLPEDFSTAPVDLAMRDLLLSDLLQPDLSNPPDLLVPGDMSTTMSYPPCVGSWCMANQPKLNGIALRTPGDGWAVGDFGAILHWDGMKWTPFPSGTSSDLQAVWATTAADAWAVGGNASGLPLTLHWDGTAWSVVTNTFAQPPPLTTVWGDAPNDYWAAGSIGCGVSLVAHYDGTSWSTPASVSSISFGWPGIGIYGTSQNDVWLVGGDNSFPPNGVSFHFDGTSWTPKPLPTGSTGNLLSVWASDSNHAWTVGPQHRSPPNQNTVDSWNGTSWSATITGLPTMPNDYHGVWASVATDAWAVGNSGSIGVVEHFFAGSWSRIPIVAPPLLAVSGSSASQVWAVGRGGGMVKWDGSQLSSTVTAPGFLRGVWTSGSSGDVFVVGDDGTNGQILRSSGGGAFTPTPTPDNAFWNSVWGTSASDVWAVGGPIIEHWNGNSWSNTQTLGPGNVLVSIQGSSASDVWAAGSQQMTGNVLLLHLESGSWIDRSPAISGLLQFLRVNSSSDAWALGTTAGGLLLHTTGTSWSKVSLPPSVTVTGGIWGTSASDIWIGARGTGSDLWYWNGSVWAGFPSGVSGSVETIWGSMSNDVWLGTQLGGLAHYQGTSWSMVLSPITDQLTAAWGTGATDVWMVGPNEIMHKGY